MTKVAVLIDGGHLRACARSNSHKYTAALVNKVVQQCVKGPAETLFRALYYDCDPFEGTVKLPIPGGATTFSGSGSLLSDLERTELFAVRRGVLKFRGWERKPGSMGTAAPTDADFEARWEQKGVDLRIGLDIVSLTETKPADLIVLITADTDLIPAMKLCRGRGLQIAGVDLPGRKISNDLKAHLDYYRSVSF
ncbi:MAG TPA: NYN domain-containing protein [Gemmatimonadaceae bacterium]